uniref:CUB domain-containing protein n=1 Tax=Panagrolaimus sp. JU765 TaxID=591449 RepID=A0AC34RPA1_9BILA
MVITCAVPVTNEPNKISVFYAAERFIEYLADKLQVFENVTGTENIFGEIQGYDTYAFEGEKNIYLKFLSDKNINGAGFIVIQNQLSCECANETFVVPCQGSQLMPIMANDVKFGEQFYTYCQSMACRYEIVANPECTSKKKVSLKITTNLKSKYDVVILSYNNKRIWNSSDGNVTNGTFDLSNMLEVVFLSAGIGQQSRWTKASNILVTVSTV